MKSHVVKQSRFFDRLNEIELYLIYFLQRVFMAEKLEKIHNYVADMLSTRYLSYSPLFLYSLGQIEEAKKLARSLIFYSFFSSIVKFTIPRLRPFKYPNVYTKETFDSSSFPSRHTIASIVISSAIPWIPIRITVILVMVLNRMIMGCHFLTDTLAGAFFGALSVYLGHYFTDMNFFVLVLIVSIYLWQNCARVIGGVLPILLASDYKCNPYVVLISVAKIPLAKIFLNFFNATTRYDILVSELFHTTLVTFVVTKISKALDLLK